MYCTRADIEQKRLAREHLLDLVDDERTGEFDNSTGAVPPSGNTQPLYSAQDSPLNTRIRECIEDADNEINAYLGGIYAVPIAEGEVPAIINTLSVNISTYYLYVRRSNTIPESVVKIYDTSLMMLKQIAARKITLLIPATDDAVAQTQSAFAVRTKSSVFAEIPY